MPGQFLRLDWQGLRPRLLARTAPLLLFVAAVGLAAAMLWQAFGADVQKAMVQGGANLIDLVPLGLIAVVGSGVAWTGFGFVLQVGKSLGYFTSLTWDSRQAEFRGVFRGTPLLGWRTIVVPLANIQSVRFSIGPEGQGPLRIDLRIELTTDGPAVAASLQVEHVDQRAEAMDLLFRMARIVGLRSYHIERNSPRRLDVAIVQEPKPRDLSDHDYDDNLDDADLDRPVSDDELDNIGADEDDGDDEFDDDEFDEDDNGHYGPELFPVPDDRSMARYEMNAPPAGFSEPQTVVAEFDPERLAASVANIKLICWEPGKLVRVHRPAWPLAASIGLPAAGGFAVGMVAGWPVFGWIALLARPATIAPWMAFVAAALIGAVALFVYWWPRMFEREVVFDWQHRLVRWRYGSRSSELSLSAVQSLSLGGVRSSRGRGGGFGRSTSVAHEYRAQLQMSLPESDEVVIETDTWKENANEPFEQLLPFTVALARALGVPWAVVDSPGPGAGLWIRFGRGKAVLLSVGLLLTGALLAWQWYNRAAVASAEQIAIAEIETAGGRVTNISSRSFRDLHSIKNVKRVDFPGGIDDAKLIALARSLSHIRRLDLDLAESQITDVGAASLGGLKNAVALDLSGTNISDSGCDRYHGLDSVEIVNLSGTRVGNLGKVGVLAMNSKLAVLLLGGTQASDADMNNLRICHNLKYVKVTNTHVTAENVAGFQKAIPGVVVEGASVEAERSPE